MVNVDTLPELEQLLENMMNECNDNIYKLYPVFDSAFGNQQWMVVINDWDHSRRDTVAVALAVMQFCENADRAAYCITGEHSLSIMFIFKNMTCEEAVARITTAKVMEG